jgi:hypothetical protein
MKTPQDIKNRKEANQRYYELEENKEQKRNYMKAYRTRPYVKAKLHEYYVVNKMHWGEIKKARNWGGKREKTKIYKYHEEWARENGYRDNDNLHAKNTERFINDAQR